MQTLVFFQDFMSFMYLNFICINAYMYTEARFVLENWYHLVERKQTKHSGDTEVTCEVSKSEGKA